MEREHALRRGLGALAREQAKWAPPMRVEAALLAEFRRRSQPVRQFGAHPPAARRFWTFRLPWFAWASAVAAILAVLLAIGGLPGRHNAKVITTETADSSDLDSGFIPLPFASAAGPAGPGDIVRVEVPRSTLVAWGIPSALEGQGDAVEADVLLGAGGVPQAVRLLEQ